MSDPAITILRRGAALLAAMPDADAKRLAAAFRWYEAEAPFGMTLDQAVGVACPHGGTPWWEAETHLRRDAALRALSRQHCAGLPITQAARHIAVMGARYQASAGRRGRLPDAAKALLDIVVQAGGFPGERRILDILRNEPRN